MTSDTIVDALLKEIPVEGLSPSQKKQMDAVLR